MTLYCWRLGLLFMGSIALMAMVGCGAEVADEDDDDLLMEESAQSSQEHGGCKAAEMKQAIAKCGSRAKVGHCHSNGPKKKPSISCK
jgi:hypothetical protein